MTCKTLSALAQAIKESPAKLVEFNIGQNFFKDKGGVKLGDSLRHNNILEKMNLTGNSFTDETAMAINRNLSQTKSIIEVNLGKNLVNIRAIDQIEANLAKNRQFKAAAELPIQLEMKN